MTSSARFRLVLGFGALLLAVVLPSLRAASDEELIAEFRQSSTALQREMLQTSDPAERVKLQQQLMKLCDDLLPRLSEKTRPILAISFKCIKPLQDDGVAYTQMVAELVSSGVLNPGGIVSREELGRRKEKIKALAAANDSLVQRFETIETTVEHMLDDSTLNAAEKRGFMIGFRESTVRKMGPVLAIRHLDQKLYVQWLTQLELFDTEWDHWHVDDAGAVQFEHPEAQQKYAAATAEIKVLSEREVAAEKTLHDRI